MGSPPNKKRNYEKLVGAGLAPPGVNTTPNCPLSDREHLQEDTRQRTANRRSQNGNRRITPVRSALTGHWQRRVCQPRPKVARRIDRVSCRPAKRQTDTPHERPNQI